MGIFRINAQCHDRFFEVLPDEVDKAEFAVEDVMSHVLLSLFGEGTVDDVTIRFPSRYQKRCYIQIYAQSPWQSFTLFPRTEEHIQSAITKSISSVLKELFGSVEVDSVKMSPSPWDYGVVPMTDY
jgi:hypothetical protein